ncbi:MAG: hypothetical protein SFU20_05860 [Chitinophagaceae bacterium]|nr:hypothetical protein [Chitinophagaceae bacterium]
MKTLKRGSLLFICVCFVLTLTAQDKPLPVREPDLSKPTLFQELPSRIPCSVSELQSLLQVQQDQRVDRSFGNGFDFRGVVTSKSEPGDSTVRSVAIRSTNFNGALMHIARITEANGSVRYTGRIISLQHQDAYELVQEKNAYYFIKKGFYDLINE